MPKTVAFRMTVPFASPTMRAQYYALIPPIFGSPLEDYPAGLPAALNKIREITQIRFNHLLKAGWHELESSRFMFCRNCPPCAVKVAPWRADCRRSICPFCYGRRVEHVFKKVNALVQSMDCTVVTIRRHCGYVQDTQAPIEFDTNGSLQPNIDSVIAQEMAYSRWLRSELLPGAIGGYHWTTIAPDTRGKYCEGFVGRWLRIHSIVAVMPKGFSSTHPTVRVLDNPTPFQLATAIGSVFRYRKAWLYSDPLVMAEFLNCVKYTRFLNPWGYFKRVAKDADRGAIAPGGQTQTGRNRATSFNKRRRGCRYIG